MWVAQYDCHHMYALGFTTTFESKHYFLAWLVYQWYAFRFLASSQPVKQVSLHYSKDGVISFKGMQRKSQNVEQLRRLKACANSQRRRYWDYS